MWTNRHFVRIILVKIGELFFNINKSWNYSVCILVSIQLAQSLTYIAKSPPEKSKYTLLLKLPLFVIKKIYTEHNKANKITPI
jgi:hypothetical protein